MKNKAIVAILATLLLASITAIATPARAQPTDNMWINMDPPVAPPARSDVCMVYDSENEVVVLFGGGAYWTQRWNWFGDTWIYSVKTNTWTNMNPAVAPCPRTFHGMAYDSDNKVVVLFGGQDNSGTLLGDTWIYNVKTNTWTNMNPAVAPSPREANAMAYDSKNKKVVLHGLPSYYSAQAETWTYDVSTNTWTNMEPSTLPQTGYPANLEYDSANNVMVLLFYLDVWTYSLDTNTWTKREPATQPPLRWTGMDVLAYDSENGRMILFGGFQWYQWFDDTWAYNVKENTWTNLNPSVSPPGRGAHGIVYDSKNKVVVMFGGDSGWYDPGKLLSDTWIYIYYPDPKVSTQKLIETIRTWNLPKGTENSLTSKLQNAIQSLENGQQNAAINKLNAFINEVKAQSGKKLTNAQADALIAEAQRIINTIQG